MPVARACAIIFSMRALAPGISVAILVLSALASPAAAQDRTSALLAQLDRCDLTTAREEGPPLDVLLALADGRSARELGALIPTPRACTGYTLASGDGDDEVVFVGNHVPGAARPGAVLWVEHGWWRIARAPLGYVPYPAKAIIARRDGREFFIGIHSGGSAGSVGVVGLRLSPGGVARVLDLRPGPHEVGASVLDDDHVLVEGRDTSDPLVKWGSHPQWPGGAQWLFERRGHGFVLVAQRQARDPYYAASVLVGGLLARDEAVMRRVASDGAVASAAALRVPDGTRFAIDPFYASGLMTQERFSWNALPDAVRVAPPTGPVWGRIWAYAPAGAFDLVFRADRDASGWRITALESRPQRAPGSEAPLP